MNFHFMSDTFLSLLAGVPKTLQLASISITAGAVFALILASLRLYGPWPVRTLVRGYVFVFRGTPLLVQIFLIYYGLGQISTVRHSFAWVYLREPFWCAVLALSMNTAAYGAEIIRGGILSVPYGQIEAAWACGMSGARTFRRIIFPLALRQVLPAYSNEIILIVKSTSLASIITLMEVTGIAYKVISQTYNAVPVFVCAGAIYLLINFAITRVLQYFERRLTPHLRPRPVRRDEEKGSIKRMPTA
ncbi:octopine/nopaline transport system permease protein [Paraburkholderia sp. GV068]|uniref:ABC transporter permease n=1 Tax=unclassified Paraburkholderia TaxID=2615204 RepID=UPI000D31CE59|nr:MULTISPECIES: ABC transporter permease [unclassified Paraburkholderia]PTQ96506.1 octopine/nopaline transport system permease protein [Paraburkholderia sp. GV072]PUB00758.1 octopine/nopaline transport system permease protein [Paraburkholderia sp. GV068]